MEVNAKQIRSKFDTNLKVTLKLRWRKCEMNSKGIQSNLKATKHMPFNEYFFAHGWSECILEKSHSIISRRT